MIFDNKIKSYYTRANIGFSQGGGELKKPFPPPPLKCLCNLTQIKNIVFRMSFNDMEIYL